MSEEHQYIVILSIKINGRVNKVPYKLKKYDGRPIVFMLKD